MSESATHVAIRDIANRFTKDTVVEIQQITDGSINETYDVIAHNDRFVLQRMNPIFSPSVMGNLALIQPYVSLANVPVVRSRNTITNDPYVIGDANDWYRSLEYVPGVTIHQGATRSMVTSVANLVGRFHSSLIACESKLATAIPHFHDTPYYMERLRQVMWANENDAKVETLEPIATSILDRYKEYTVDLDTLPQRVIHGDLKISNTRFDEQGNAVALIDMDTLMRHSVVVEMGDALRSWCGTAGEDDPEQIFDVTLAKASLEQYAETAIGITKEELDLIPYGIGLLTLELAARFVTDAYEETYFALNSQYDSLYEQNVTRGRNQLVLFERYKEVESQLL